MKSVGGIYDPENPDWLSWRMPTMIAELRKISTSYDTDFDSILYTTLGLCEKQESSIWQTLSWTPTRPPRRIGCWIGLHEQL